MKKSDVINIARAVYATAPKRKCRFCPVLVQPPNTTCQEHVSGFPGRDFQRRLS